MNAPMGGWRVSEIVCRPRCMHTGTLARSLVRQANGNAWQTSRTHVKNGFREALPRSVALVKFRGAGIGFTGAHLPHERVDRDDGMF